MRTKALSTVLAAGTLAMLGGATAAQASNATLRAAVQRANDKIDESSKLKAGLAELPEATRASLESTGKLVARESANLLKAKSSVKAQKASSGAAKEGRAEWLTALQKVIFAYGDYKTAIVDFEGESDKSAEQKAKAGKSLLRSGLSEMRHAELLMKVRNPG